MAPIDSSSTLSDIRKFLASSFTIDKIRSLLAASRLERLLICGLQRASLGTAKVFSFDAQSSTAPSHCSITTVSEQGGGVATVDVHKI
jgi:hypothetical protein